MFKVFKKFVSILMFASCFATAFVCPAGAVKSANSNNSLIVSEVDKFNKERLHKLQKYIERIGSKSAITKDLKVLYGKLDNLVVSSVELAAELNAPNNQDVPSPKIGCQLGRLFGFLEIICKEYTQDTFTAEMRSASIIKFLIGNIDRINV